YSAGSTTPSDDWVFGRHTAAPPLLTCNNSLTCDHRWHRGSGRDTVSSGILMIIVLTVMWLVVLVPMFVRRNEQDEPAAAAGSGSRVRVLTRRTPRRRSWPDGHAPREHRTAAPERAGIAAAAFSGDQARRRMLRRRRRTLALLALLAVLGLVGAL